ncbi:MAG TPA: carbon-nitrogen hydrolase family protein [Actinomycetota bacterium]|nr:carbon-nitrogen hydrolase family protein [Actinomycetota bacterium]
MRPLPILAVQAAPVPWEVDATWEKFEVTTRRLVQAFPSTKLVVYPELFLSAIGPTTIPPRAGYSVERVAQRIPGPLTERLGELAEELQIWLVPGSVYEIGDAGRIYNTAVAVRPDGSIAARYRKIFPWRPWERSFPGEDLVLFDIDDVGRVGLMICYDGWFPEVARNLAWLGAELILQPAATWTSDREQELVLVRAQAITNQVIVVNVNVGGGYGEGRSLVVDPEGHVLQAAGGGEEVITDVLDFDGVRRVRQYGSVGMNRLWEEVRERQRIRLPMYGGSLPGMIQPSA